MKNCEYVPNLFSNIFNIFTNGVEEEIRCRHKKRKKIKYDYFLLEC